MTVRNLNHLLAPTSVTLIGASNRPGSIGRVLAANMTSGAFRGPVWLVNPRATEIAGQRCYNSIAALPAAPSLAIIATPSETIPGIVDELGAKGCRAVVVISAGVRGAHRQAMLDAARPHLLRIQGPNCLGLMLPTLGLNASFSHIAPRNGRLAFLSQSGALITGVIDWAASRGIGFSHVVSLGDMADVDFGDMLDYLAGDRGADAILIYMESLASAPKFMSAMRRAARAKPVVIIKAGRHAAGAEAAHSHTGALAGADAAYEAAFRRGGVVRVHELSELFEAAEILSKSPGIEGERLGIITNGGGAGVLAADRLEDLGLEPGRLSPQSMARLDAALPPTWSRGNPIDIIGDAGADRYASALDVAFDDPGLDALLVINCPTALNPGIAAAEATTCAINRRRSADRKLKPVITNWLGTEAAAPSRALFAAHDIPTFDTPSEAVGAFAQLVRWHRAQTELMATPASLQEAVSERPQVAARIIQEALTRGPGMLTEPEAKGVLSAYGLSVVPTEAVASPHAAAEVARGILAAGGACVLKILSPDITHKSDVGGVRLALESPEAVEAAANRMLVRVREALPAAVIDGFTVQPMVIRPGAHELLLGMSEDPTFGPLMAFGAGGVAVEAVRDVAHALPPLDANLARDTIRQTRVWRLLQGYRDRPAADIGAIADALVRLGRLVAAHPEIREVDINPLLADADGAVVLDARIRVVDAKMTPRVAMAIRPYPSEWEKRVSTTAIGGVLLRPIRPEDERLYEAFFARVSADDARLRFFAPQPESSHRFLARLTQIDYAREMAFVALDDAGVLLGVARLIADPDLERAEYAVLVRSDLKGRGLGWTLMQHLIAFARATGLAEIHGDVLHENATMIGMCRELGFTVKSDPDDATLMRVTLNLRSTSE